MSGSRLTPWTEDAPRQSCSGLALMTWKISGSKKILLEAGSLTGYSHGDAPRFLVSSGGRKLFMATNEQQSASEDGGSGQVGRFWCYYTNRLLCCLAWMRFECVCLFGCTLCTHVILCLLIYSIDPTHKYMAIFHLTRLIPRKVIPTDSFHICSPVFFFFFLYQLLQCQKGKGKATPLQA